MPTWSSLIFEGDDFPSRWREPPLRGRQGGYKKTALVHPEAPSARWSSASAIGTNSPRARASRCPRGAERFIGRRLPRPGRDPSTTTRSRPRPRWSRARPSPPTGSTVKSKKDGDEGEKKTLEEWQRLIADGDLAESVEARTWCCEAVTRLRASGPSPRMSSPFLSGGPRQAIADEHAAASREVLASRGDRQKKMGGWSPFLGDRGAAIDRPPHEVRDEEEDLGLVGKGVTLIPAGSRSSAASMHEMKMDMSGRGGARGGLRDPQARAADQPARGDPRHREHAERVGGETGRHHHPAEREDCRGQQHRRRGPADPRRRARIRGRPRRRSDLSIWRPSPERSSSRLGLDPREARSIDDAWAAEVEGALAGLASHWRLPLHLEKAELHQGHGRRSTNASAKRKAGTIYAGSFLEEFVDGKPGSTTSPGPRGTWDEYVGKGPTGFGVATP